MKFKIHNKIILIVTITAFCISCLSIYFYIRRMSAKTVIETFKIYPIIFSNEDHLKLSDQILKANENTTRIKIIIGQNLIIDSKNLKKDPLNMSNYDWLKLARSLVRFDDFSGSKIFLMPAEINLQKNLIWSMRSHDYLLSLYIWKRLKLNELLSLENYILVNVLNMILREVISVSHNPSTNRCLSDYARDQRNLIVSFQNGPLCHSCQAKMYDKESEVLRDFYYIYNVIECKGKRHIAMEKKTDKIEIERLLFPKSQKSFDWHVWFGNLTVTIISALIGLLGTYKSSKWGKKEIANN